MSYLDFIKDLSQGGGSVRVMRHSRTKRMYVVKVVADEREAVVHSAVMNHPNIVRLVKYWKEDQRVVMLMDPSPQNLHDNIVQFGHLSLVDTIRVSRQILDGMLHIKSHGVVHGDIKLQNILIGSDSVLRICDFGSATYGGSDDVTTTPCYRAPEVIAGEKTSFASDVWSFGVVVFTMLFGSYPFDTDAHAATEVLAVPSGTHADVANMLEKCLCKDPQIRITLEDLSTHVVFKQPLQYWRDQQCF